MQCWERHNRYLVTDEVFDKNLCLTAKDGLSLLVEYDFGYPTGPVAAMVMDAEYADPEFVGDRWCHRFALVKNDDEALEWFEGMNLARPWLTRQ